MGEKLFLFRPLQTPEKAISTVEYSTLGNVFKIPHQSTLEGASYMDEQVSDTLSWVPFDR